MSVLYIRDKATGKFVPITTIQGAAGQDGNVEGIEYYEQNPSALGEASSGTSDLIARGDHVHPLPTPEEIGALPVDYPRVVEFKVEIKAAGWSPVMTDSPMWSNYVRVQGLLESDKPMIDVVTSGIIPFSRDALQSVLDAWSKVYRIDVGENYLYAYCLADDVPDVSFNIKILCVR